MSLGISREEQHGWLIEDRTPGDHSLYMKLGDEPLHTKYEERGPRRKIYEKFCSPLHFTKDASEALRFARKEDADAFIRKGMIAPMSAKAVEHSWIAFSDPTEEME